jgi:hypothetical protein
MSDKPQIGRNVYNDALRRGRKNTKVARDALRRLVEDSPGPQTIAMLVTQIAVSVGNIEAVFVELDEIGRTAKLLK